MDPIIVFTDHEKDEPGFGEVPGVLCAYFAFWGVNEEGSAHRFYAYLEAGPALVPACHKECQEFIKRWRSTAEQNRLRLGFDFDWNDYFPLYW